MVNLQRLGAMLVVVMLASGCGGKAKTPTTTGPADPAEAESDCEPGRCLADVSARVEDRRPAARACYDEGQKRVPELQGRLIINFEINPDGTVADASQSAQDDQIMDEQVVACVADVIKGIKFAESKKGKRTRAFHRYEFNPKP